LLEKYVALGGGTFALHTRYYTSNEIKLWRQEGIINSKNGF